MYKHKKDVHTFLQPKKVRKISFIEIFLILVALYVIYISIPKIITAKSLLFFFIIVVYALSRFVVPPFIKQYNAIITNEYIVIENQDLNSIKIFYSEIDNIKKIDERTIVINSNKEKVNFNYSVHLDENEADLFIKIFEKNKEDNRFKVRKEIESNL